MDSVASIGTVVSVRGAVVDVAFDAETLPPINTAHDGLQRITIDRERSRAFIEADASR
jgi:F0F1-type ATP synthase beta subunit